MDLGWGNQKASKFVTSVGLITSHGPNGQNIMGVEWTYYVSWSPALITVHIGKAMGGKGKATLENIGATREFGVNIAADDQNVFSSIAGGSSGHDVDKMAVLRGMGAQFYKARQIGAPMLLGAALNAECRVKEIVDLGDHAMVVGEVLEIESHDEKKPLAYSFGKYYQLGEQIHKPKQEVLDRIAALAEKNKKKKP
ncbi:MAG: flavin reductase family protein [Candidatus Micrarchaeia archaeon]|jgi:flavin reductase (DIM6/NTAB) family NADH-FMN oxidoreductase RutF